MALSESSPRPQAPPPESGASPAIGAETVASSNEADQGWTKVISSQRGFFDIPWRDIWRYRDLILLLAKRDLSTSSKQTVLGPFWFVLQPLMVTVVFSYLFGRMGRLGTDDIPHYLFYMSGLVIRFL